MDWEVEKIPGSANLFLRVHSYEWNHKRGAAHPGAFSPKPKSDPNASLSVNWDKYICPRCTTKVDAPQHHSVYGVLALRVADVTDESLPRLEVKHSPTKFTNRAHSSILGIQGPDRTEARLKLSRLSTVVIEVPKLKGT